MRMRAVRLWLPVVIIAAGILLVIVTGGSESGFEGGTMLVAAGLSVWLLNWFYRLGVRGDRDRDQEDRARTYFDEHGYWPDDERARAPAPPAADPPADPHRRARGDPHRPGRRPGR
jgi:hypothetical protein